MSETPIPVRAALEEGGALCRLVLDQPKGNILDRTMIGALRREIAAVSRLPAVRAVVIEGAGKHFSFGASVEEHRADLAPAMLAGFHAMFHELAGCGKFLIAAVRGQCLGGGLEVAAFCHRVVASADAKLGNPEIKLGVFAPVGSLVLPMRVGQPHADDLLLSGRTVDAAEALRMGLVDEIADDPTAAAATWVRTHLLPLSATALRHALAAARHRFYETFFSDLARLERNYTGPLMATADANEGIASFLEKRAASWTHA